MARSSRDHELDQEYEDLLERLQDARLEGDTNEIRRLERQLKSAKRRSKHSRRDNDL